MAAEQGGSVVKGPSIAAFELTTRVLDPVTGTVIVDPVRADSGGHYPEKHFLAASSKTGGATCAEDGHASGLLG